MFFQGRGYDLYSSHLQADIRPEDMEFYTCAMRELYIR